jgi:DNA repair protein RadC
MPDIKTDVSHRHKGEGHRKRLRDKFLKAGIGEVHDYEIVGLLLL